MVQVTATLFKSLMQLTDSDITDTNMEYVLDQAIHELNLRGTALANMTGTAGSKTWNGESKEAGAVQHAARVVYESFYKDTDVATVGGLSVSSSDLMKNPVVDSRLDKIARRLTEIEVDVG